jgi:predicted SnoaL-like aldol condensation-catalyzing enzyme
MKIDKKQKIYDLLKGIETGDPESFKVVNESKYIQHNPQTHEGGEGLASLFTRLSKTNPKVEIIRLFEDGDYVFGHTIYEFSTVRIGFEVFRYEGDQVVEHWDNIQLRVGDMVAGTTNVSDLELTEENREFIKTFIDKVFIKKEIDNFSQYSSLMDLSKKTQVMDYKKNHRLLAQGNFVLSVSEGENDSVHSSFYDLFRIESGKIVEHWETIEKVPAKSEWKNNNGKF